MFQQTQQNIVKRKKLKMKKNKNSTIMNYKSTPIFKNKMLLTMKKLMILLITCLFFLPIKGQKSDQLQTPFKQKVPWKPYVPREISMKQFVPNKQDLGLLENNELNIVTKTTNKNRINEEKFVQTIGDKMVEGSMIITRQDDSQVYYKGHFVPGLSLDTNPSIKESEALQFAINSMNIIKPSWEDQAYEKLLKTVKNDPNATNYPKGELVIYDNNYSQIAENYRLAYKFQIFSIEPLSNQTVYVDAHTGLVLGSEEKIHNCTETCNLKPATATTNYHDTVSIEVCTDDIETYFLDHPIGATFTANNRDDLSTICIESTDSLFEENPTANEVYWATHQYYEYLLNTFGRKSIDDNNHGLAAIVNYRKAYPNAHWNGSFAIFGDGDGEILSSLTSLDIVAHEFTHGLIDYTAQLIYRNESGALNESFADIFGILLEYYAFGETDWQIGNHFTLQHSSLRNFVNPKDLNQYNGPFPNTYMGEHWIPKNGKDNGGVHFNSSVQNFFFYLLSAGGSGVNDNGDDYNIEGVGIEKAAQIMYQNLTNLFPTATFMDSREGAIQAAKDIFGEDSFEAEQVELAWCAVGVGVCFETTCNREADSLALVAMYNAMPNNGEVLGWDLEKSISEWRRVVFNEEGCVKGIRLYPDNGATTGYIPPEIGNFSQIEYLWFDGDGLIGPIPPEIGNLQTLEWINLRIANNSGNIPEEIYDLINLKELTLFGPFTGTISPKVEQLKKLENLKIWAGFGNEGELYSLSGEIPPEIGNLPNLQELSLVYQTFSGGVPSTITQLTNLKTLVLRDNHLTGDISWLGDLISLEHVNLMDNYQMGGNIPASIDKLQNLKSINFLHNNFSGEIPEELCSCRNLEEVILGGNSLTGSIPSCFGRLTNLERLDLGSNSLEGEIPKELGNLNNLKDLRLSNNQLEGSIPSTFENLDSLTTLSIFNNNLSGCFSDQLSSLCRDDFNVDPPSYPPNADHINYGNNFDATWEDFCATNAGSCNTLPPCNRAADSLALVALYNAISNVSESTNWDLAKPIEEWNRVEFYEPGGCVKGIRFHPDFDVEVNGFVPPEIGNFSQIEYLWFYWGLSGPIPTEIGNLKYLKRLIIPGVTGNIPDEIFNCESLESLQILGNLTGSLSPKITQLKNLQKLDIRGPVEGVGLTGIIPPEIGQLTNLQSIEFDWHDFDNGIPVEISNLKNLSYLSIRRSGIEGGIPTGIWNLSKLETLVIGGDLIGEIPKEINNLVNLKTLSLGNQLTGEIPNELCSCTNLIYLRLDSNNFDGGIPNCIGQLVNLENLGMSSTSLEGEIPKSIGNLINLIELRLELNELTGTIPNEIGNLKNLTNLQLANNQLKGIIPASFAQLENLEYFTVSDNGDLSGCFPSELKALCHLNFDYSDNWPVFGHAIDKGNNFDAPWDDFCTKDEGICSIRPGDFNADECLSYVDVLYWGLAEGNTGPQREDTSTDWSTKIATDWESEVNGINGKHQDANGDGVVDIADLIVFVNNFEIDSTRCESAIVDNAKIEQDYPDYISLNPIASINDKEDSYEMFIHSKIDNIGLQLHGFEFQVVIKGYQEGDIKYINLDTSPFKAPVEVVDTLIYLGNNEYLYKAAVTRFDNNNSKFERNGAGAILVIGIEDLPAGTAKDINLKPSGSYLYASANAVPLSLQSTHMYINKEDDITVNIVPSQSKGILEVFVQTENGINTFTIDNYPFAVGPSGIPSENSFHIDIDNSSEQGRGIIISDDNGFISDVINSDCLPNCPPPSSIPLPLFPNPAIDIVQFDLAYVDHCNQKVEKIGIYDLAGYLVQTVQPQQIGDCVYQIEVSDLPHGIYFIDVSNGDHQFHNKFIKQ